MSKTRNVKGAAAVAGAAPCSATLRELVKSFRRMGDDANHVRLSHLTPRRGHIKSDTMIRERWAGRADAFYHCMRTVQVLLPNTSDG